MRNATMTNPTSDTEKNALVTAQIRSRRARNVAIGLAMGFLVVLFYVITIAKLGGNAFTKTM